MSRAPGSITPFKFAVAEGIGIGAELFGDIPNLEDVPSFNDTEFSQLAGVLHSPLAFSSRSSATAMASSRGSLPGLPISCIPTGMPAWSRPTGSVTAQRPRKLTTQVLRSMRRLIRI